MHLPPASLEVSRHVIVVKRCSTTLQGGESSGLDCQIQQYIQHTATSTKVCMTASSQAASHHSPLQTQLLPCSEAGCSRKRHEARL